MSQALLKLQLGPVQDFIAASRSTRDLWSGSFLLSWLMATACRALAEQGGTLVFPNPDKQPLINPSGDWENNQRLIPNLPNVLVARTSSDKGEKVAAAMESAIKKEWKDIADSVWAKHEDLKIDANLKDCFNSQIENFLSIAWQITPINDEAPNAYAEAYRDNGWHMDATRQLRDFQGPQHFAGSSHEKDSLLGTLETIKSGNDVTTQLQHLFKHKSDHHCAITLIKRLWHITYLGKEGRPTADSDTFRIPDTRQIAVREIDKEGQMSVDSLSGEKYLAAIAFDGDSIGKWIGGKFHEDAQLEKLHGDFSKSLSTFALEQVDQTVKAHDGFLIYAGGDDVLALCPADEALSLAQALRHAFQKETKSIATDNEKPDASAGIAIAHFKSPLQDIIREAQAAEKRAKNDYGRSAFAVTLMKHSGETSHWGSKWESHALELYEAILKEMLTPDLSNKFPHRACQLLTPYLTAQTGISEQSNTIDADTGKSLITREFEHAAIRQGSKETAKKLLPSLESHLAHLPDDFQTQLKALIGLCTTAAFVHRNIEAGKTQNTPQPANA